MHITPEVQPLPYQNRVWFFRILLLIFVLCVPVFTFYATGYRISFSGDEGNIISVGGIFMTVTADNTTTYINDETVDDFRVFQQAAYIQNLPAGTHRLHVQGEGLHTWVKQLEVYPHIVTEAEAFNLPAIPQIRLITEYQTVSGEAVVFGASTTTPFASGTVAYRAPWVIATTSATSTYERNPEYIFVTSLFSSSTDASTTLRTRYEDTFNQFTFSSAESPEPATSTATTTVAVRDQILYESEGELFVAWSGSDTDIPYYYCDQVSIRDAVAVYKSDAMPEMELQRICQKNIMISRWGQDVFFFNFFPGNDDLILMHRSDGVHVAEIDNRGWQNEQKLYPAGEAALVMSGDQIYLYDNGYYFELLTELDD